MGSNALFSAFIGGELLEKIIMQLAEIANRYSMKSIVPIFRPLIHGHGESMTHDDVSCALKLHRSVVDGNMIGLICSIVIFLA